MDLFSPEAFPRKIAWSVRGRLPTAAAVLFLPRMVGRAKPSETCIYMVLKPVHTPPIFELRRRGSSGKRQLRIAVM